MYDANIARSDDFARDVANDDDDEDADSLPDDVLELDVADENRVL